MTNLITQLYNEYHAPLVRMIYRRTGDRARAEDIVQETFARALQSPPDNPRPWLFAVALNLVREDGRRSVRQGRRLQLLRPEADQPGAQPDESMQRDEERERVRAALGLLSERDREALLLKAEGFNYDEIAEALGMARSAIGTTLARARRRLVEAYQARSDGGEAKHAARD